MLILDRLAYNWPGSMTQVINLKADLGQLIVISGPSGIGKSTLFDVITGFHKPSSGNIMWGDKNLLVEPPWLRPISVMFQSDNFFPHLSIRKNLMLGVKNSKKLIERMHYYMNFLEVYDLLNRQPESLSGGELQRVSLIHALMREMPILMLDEPFSALDLDMVEKSSQLIKEDMQINKSIHLIISHQDITPFLAADQIIELS